ncbi:DUF4145 domain-containing protein [Pseudomonas sp. AOB-7]|uniref:DUF4145 domain-containing protein n=1 Tax=Pseudomonas sp. AOB-7 TaxID=2482750 RepID=UPI000EFC88F5|nr:DUF4145 domain-containing protein [Pseudomonas sp. AOB-7]RMH82576.1 DUF4145 domain-containing protein [Pseudomonas sp. AOB-7]
MNFTAPEFKLEAFHCPTCGTYAHMTWEDLGSQQGRHALYTEAICSKCKNTSLWRITKYSHAHYGRLDEEAELIFPDFGVSALPEDDMPEDVKSDYIEASRIFSRSPRGAAALLRLALQKLCKHLGEPGKNINEDIRSLAAKNTLPPLVVKVADTVRITGNNAVHPGEMSDEDFDHVASKMFELLNFIVKKGISEPKELEALYSKTPEKPRKDAETKDAKAKAAGT